MTSTKLKMDLSQGLIEVEGTEKIVMAIYTDFKDKIESGIPVQSENQTSERPRKNPKPKKAKTVGQESAVPVIKGKKKSGSSMPSIVKDLDLSGRKKGGRLKDFYSLYDAMTNFDRNLIFVYYLQEKLGVKDISVDHIFTCYRDIGLKVPKALHQSLLDTNNRKGWIDTSDTGKLSVTIPGVNYLEHDMPKKNSDT